MKCSVIFIKRFIAKSFDKYGGFMLKNVLDYNIFSLSFSTEKERKRL